MCIRSCAPGLLAGAARQHTLGAVHCCTHTHLLPGVIWSVRLRDSDAWSSAQYRHPRTYHLIQIAQHRNVRHTHHLRSRHFDAQPLTCGRHSQQKHIRSYTWHYCASVEQRRAEQIIAQRKHFTRTHYNEGSQSFCALAEHIAFCLNPWQLAVPHAADNVRSQHGKS